MSAKFEAWGLVELMGHQRVAGRLTEQVIAGANLLRVDVPMFGANDEHEGAFRTVMYGPSAIYAVHVTGEQEAIQLAKKGGTRPAYAWELERTPALTDQSRSRSSFENEGSTDDTDRDEVDF